MTVKEPVMRRAAIAYDKLRTQIALVGIEAKKDFVYVKLARRWPTEQINEMVEQTADLYRQMNWGTTYIEQESGEYLISLLSKRHGMPVSVVTTQKKVKEAKKIQKIKVMDKIEMTEFLRKLKLNGQIRFVSHPTKHMKNLEDELPNFAKHTTEAGSVDYYASGAEPDGSVKALMLACFSVRNILEGDDGTAVIGQFIQESPLDLENIFGEIFPNSTFN